VLSKRDQLQAHQFMVDRLVSALVRGEANSTTTPMRRANTGLAIGVFAGVILLVGVLVYRLIAPHEDMSWKRNGTLIVEQDTGTRYLYLDNTLRPVLNYASAVLAIGSVANATPHVVSAQSLAGVPRGHAIGIPGAPDTVPAPSALSRTPWSMCTGGNAPSPTIDALLAPAQGAVPVDDHHAVLVQTPHGAEYLAWRGKRLRVDDRAGLIALDMAGVAPLPVDPAWLNLLAAGPDLVARPPAGLGAAGPTLLGSPTRVGQVLGVGGQWFVVHADGLAPIDAVSTALLLADPADAGAYDAGSPSIVSVSAAQIAVAPRSATSAVVAGYPAAVPVPVSVPTNGGRALCLRFALADDQSDAGELITVALPANSGTAAVAGAGHGRIADRVVAAPGVGILAAVRTGPGQVAADRYLIDDLGVKYPLSPDALGPLGYDNTTAFAVPINLLALLPTGPNLDPAAARTSFDAGGGCGTMNAAHGRPAVASSTENAGTPASAAVDGNTGTRWSSAFSDPQWIYVDLGAPQTVCQVVLTWERAYATAFQIQVSNDAATWTSIFSTVSGTGGTQTLNVSGSGRYVRMYGTARAIGYGYSLWEFAVYVVGGGTTTSPTPSTSPIGRGGGLPNIALYQPM
jgi:type VII secretion protein EccB